MRLLVPLWFLLATLIAPINANAADIKCAIEKYRSYATAQEQWQRAVTDLIVKNANVNLKDVAMLYLGDQLNLIEMNRIGVEFMLLNAPDKVRLEGPLNQWLTLERDDRMKIAKGSNRYAELLRLADAARQRPPHPDGDTLRALMRDRIVRMAEYQNLLASFNAAVAKANSNACSGPA